MLTLVWIDTSNSMWRIFCDTGILPVSIPRYWFPNPNSNPNPNITLPETLRILHISKKWPKLTSVQHRICLTLIRCHQRANIRAAPSGCQLQDDILPSLHVFITRQHYSMDLLKLCTLSTKKSTFQPQNIKSLRTVYRPTSILTAVFQVNLE